jgi:cytochrome bd ubiquinol oxidase subunit II
VQIFWFIVVAVFWVGFLVLEGFDFGVGALHRFVGRSDTEQRVAINAIGPFWDGNEVWLVVAGAAIFAAFPSWYASMFSALYLALLIVLVALIGRGVSFEFRSKTTTPRWRETWSWITTIASLLLPVLIGVALGDLFVGLPINSSGDYTGSFWNLLTPYGIFVGLTFLALTLTHGATFLDLKTTGEVQQRAHRYARILTWVALAAVLGFMVWTMVIADRGVLPPFITVVALLAMIGATWAVRERYAGGAFTATALAIAATVGTIFVELYPNVMVSSTGSANNLTVANSASSPYALGVMTIIALVFVPLVLAYQCWNFYVFRARIRAPRTTTPDTADSVAT